MAQINLDIPLIRDGKKKEFVLYLNRLREDQSDIAICKSLFEAVDHELIPPSTFSVFLSWSNSIETVVLCMKNESSCSIRKTGINQFGKSLANPERWDSAWKAVGGTTGLVNLLAAISVIELKAITRVIGCCNRGQHRVEAREKAIEELVHALLPSYYPGSKSTSHDGRLIDDHYAQMVSACSPNFVARLLDAKDTSNPLYRCAPTKRLIKTHKTFLQKRAIEGIFGDGSEKDFFNEYPVDLIYGRPPTTWSFPPVLASMTFAKKILKLRLEDISKGKRWPTSISETDILFSLLRRSMKRRLPEPDLRDIFMLGLQLLETKPELKDAFQQRGLWHKLLTRWMKFPNIYDDLLVLALRLNLAASPETIGQNFFEILQQLQKDLTWPLLRLYCLHVPKKGIDIDTTENFNQLAKQPWPSDIFYCLNKEKAIRLLRGLLNANPEYRFLRGPASVSILSDKNGEPHHNFNATLLLAVLQRGSEEAQTLSGRIVKELRKKATTTTEQSYRAIFAKAASAYAIGSGSLDLYGDTITWQQRYVRDPLTLKVIFGRGAVATSEGVDLLSGIPQPFPENMTLDEVALRVEKSNDILMTFHETMLIVKREPSFYEGDWAGVISLFNNVIKTRAARTEDVHKHIRSKMDVYNSIWGGTLTMLGNVNIRFLEETSRPIKGLLDILSPTALVAASEAMLVMGDKKRKEQDRQFGDDILERLSYESILLLAKSDKPQLTQQLVLRAVLDRPDASSWHRQLLSASLMKSLSPKDARRLLLAFSGAIGEKREEQSYVKVGGAQPPQSLVKITTVKYLAQLLDNAEFISIEAAVEVLVELFKAGAHRDILLATLDSLLGLLNSMCRETGDSWKSNVLVQKILGALETVIPTVGSVNEYRPPRLDDWEKAKETGKVPDISDTTIMPPLLGAIFKASDGDEYPALRKLQPDFVARLLLPILEYSQEEHQKWVALFLTKHKANITIDDLPPTPLTPRLWVILLRSYPKFTPEKVLEIFNKYITITIAPPKPLEDFNRSLRVDAELCNTPEVQHWFSVFGQRKDRYNFLGTHTLASMIHHDLLQPLVRNGITFSKVADMVVSHASLIIHQYEKYRNVWYNFVDGLRHPSKARYGHKDADSIRSMVSTWEKSGKYVLEKITALVLDKRAQYIREQRRRILPSATKLRLWLLPYPCFPEIADIDHECKYFSRELEGLLNSFLQGEANVLRWHKIAEDAFTISDSLNTYEERLRVALYIGGLSGRSDETVYQISPALNLVRVTLAMRLIDDGQGYLIKTGKSTLSEQEKVLARGLRRMIEEWQNDVDEDILETVGDWKSKEEGLWKSLMAEEEI